MTAQLPPIVIDFETFYASDYSLTKTDAVRYVLDARFEVIGFSYAELGQGPSWFTGSHDEILQHLKSLRLDERMVIAHNAMFEGAIIEWRFGIRPFRYFCTMMGQRPYITPFTGSMSLGSGADYLGLPQKGGTVKKFIDRNRVSFTQAELLEYGDYCCNDVTLTGGVYLFLDQRIPDDEALLLDLTIKKFTRGKFALDRDVLDEALQTVLDTEAKALLSLDALGLKRIDVTSNPRLASHLQKRGVNVPVKPSPADPTKTTFAFAKTDSEFVALRHHSDPVVALLVETRLLLKSTIERTRLQQFIDIESITSRLPVPLLYYGAHTGRFSGMMGINLQNLPRSSALRKAIIAPPGYKVVSADLSAIEARITAVLAGQWDLVDRFAAGADVYSEFATALYGYEVTNCDATFTERFIGKMCILGLGFGMGVAKFEATLEAMGIPITPELAAKTVALYRRKYRQIPQLWRRMDECVSKMMELQNGLAWYGYPSVGETILTFKQKQMILPNDMPIFYPKLCRDGKNGAQYLNYEGPGNAYWKPLWGGSLTENAVQALARIIISRAELRLARAGLVSALQVHDELVFVVPENTVEQVVKVVTKVLTDPVPWMPRLPLACKVGIGDSYGAAK